MKQKDSIIIETSKKAVTIGLIGSIVFVLIGILMISKPDLIKRYSETYSQTWGVIGISFFSLTAIYLAKKIFDKSPGLILDENGLTNNSSLISKHFIKWNELKAASLTKMGKEKNPIPIYE